MSDKECSTYEALSRRLAHSADLLSTWGPSAAAVAPMNVTCTGFPSMLAFLCNVKRKQEAAGSRSSASNKQGTLQAHLEESVTVNQSFAPRHRSQDSGPAGTFCCISSTPSSLCFTVGQVCRHGLRSLTSIWLLDLKRRDAVKNGNENLFSSSASLKNAESTWFKS